jgi:hypothetical protein
MQYFKAGIIIDTIAYVACPSALIILFPIMLRAGMVLKL